jgi:hypothetical protein
MPPLTPQPIAEAVSRLASRLPVGSTFASAEWERVPVALRETAFFSARVESARLLDAMQRGLVRRASLIRDRVANGETLISRDSWIADMRGLAEQLGVQTVGIPGAGGLQDIRSNARLGLIYDLQTQRAAEFARWKVEQDPDVLDAYPAQELIRIESREVPRDWRDTWLSAGGELVAGRMVALKSDRVWTAISRFGTPWPPFDFNSGMGVEDIDRAEAEALGLIEPGERPQPIQADFTEGLEANVSTLSPDLLSGLVEEFGDRVEVTRDAIRWRASA